MDGILTPARHDALARRRRYAVGVLGLAGLLPLLPAGPLRAAEAMSGEVSVGWREVSVDGDRAKYRQHVNLDDGPRLVELGLRWTAQDRREAASLAPDRVALRLEDLGGDPYERVRAEVDRAGRYQVRYRRDESDYFYEDLLVLPENASVTGSTGGDFRRFDFRRVRDAATASVDVSERMTLQLDVDRYRKRGDSTTVMDIEREEFELDAPVDESMTSAGVGVTYAWDRASVTVAERYTSFDYGSSMFLPGLSPGSEPDAPGELATFFLDQPYRLESWEHRLDARARPDDRLSLGVSVLAADVDLDLRAAEVSSGTDFSGNPFSRNVQGVGAIDQDRRLYDLSGSYRVTGRVGVFGRLRRVTLDQAGGSSFGSEVDAVSDWQIDTTHLEAGLEVAVSAAMQLAVGWVNESRDVDFLQQDADAGAAGSLDSDADGYFVRLSYRPVRHLDLYLDVEDDNVDDPFTLASYTDARRYRLRGRYRWNNGFSASAGYLRAERHNDRSDWNADTEQVDVRVGYGGERLGVSAGLSRVTLRRSVDALVIGGSAERLFAIDYAADADSADVSVTWRLTAALTGGASLRRYDNAGSFDVERDDVRVFLHGLLGPGYRWGVEYRNVDYAEDIEAFDADILELSVGLQW